MYRPASFLALLSAGIMLACPALSTQLPQLDQIQVAPPMRQVVPPSPNATAQQLEQQGDELRSQKAYLDAIDYFRAALEKAPERASLYNKIGISELMLQRYRESGKSFEQAIKHDRTFPDPYNNLGVVDYERQKYRAAIKQYKKALKLSPESASFYSNLGAVYFAKKKFEEASQAYLKAVQLDPTVFEHSSRTGIAAQMASPQDQARYDYVLAKLFAKIGDRDHSLEYLRKAMEGGYKRVKDAYTDPEFADMRKDERFQQIMKESSSPLPE